MSYKHTVLHGAEVTPRSRAAPALALPLPAAPSRCLLHPQAARSTADGHGDFRWGRHKGSGRKENGWPLVAPVVPAGPRAVPPLPCPPWWWPQRVQPQPTPAGLPALPSPPPDHNAEHLRTRHQALPLKMLVPIATRRRETRGFSDVLSNER